MKSSVHTIQIINSKPCNQEEINEHTSENCNELNCFRSFNEELPTVYGKQYFIEKSIYEMTYLSLNPEALHIRYNPLDGSTEISQ